MGRWLRL